MATDSEMYLLERTERLLEMAEQTLVIATRKYDRWSKLHVYAMVLVIITVGILLEQCDAVSVVEVDMEDKTLLLADNFFLWTLAAFAFSIMLVLLVQIVKGRFEVARALAFAQRDSARIERENARKTVNQSDA